ncbi:MAG: DUF502 domain-containing protein [Chlamydiales bacterium]|nr:DUF502 domain-containing protein [Chlamydiales bacterium]
MFGKIFLKGLMAVLPIAITLTLVIWILDAIERVFGFFIKAIVGPEHYYPGSGVIVGLVFVFIVGLIMNAWIVQKIYSYSDSILKRIPLVKSLYGSICDMMNFFKAKKDGSEVVMVTIGENKVLGIVTRDSFLDLPKGIGSSGEVAVYIPMSYQLGGFTLILPKSSVTKIDMSIEKAMRFAVTAGMQVSTPRDFHNA